jgi:hypothetical protein
MSFVVIIQLDTYVLFSSLNKDVVHNHEFCFFPNVPNAWNDLNVFSYNYKKVEPMFLFLKILPIDGFITFRISHEANLTSLTYNNTFTIITSYLRNIYAYIHL